MEGDPLPAAGGVRNDLDVGTAASVVQAGVIHGGVVQSHLTVRIAAMRAVVPRQLPSCNPHFIGRTMELHRLDSLLDGDEGGGRAIMISAIDGTAGIGKTALALFWAHRVAARFPDGQLYVNLRGFDPGGQALSTDQVVQGFLDAFDVPPERVPGSPHARVGLYRSILAQRRMLILLDNARDADHMRNLLPGGSTSLVVATSRNKMTDLVVHEGAYSISLDVLTRDDAIQLVQRRLGAVILPATVDQLVDRCGRLPLALSIVAARASENPMLPLGTLIEELKDERTRLDFLNGGAPAVDLRTVFASSYGDLSPEGARLFAMLGVHPGPDVSTAAAAASSGGSVERTRSVMRELTRANLVIEHQPARFLLHDLVWAYARDCVHSRLTVTERDLATGSLLAYYLCTATAAALTLAPYRVEISLPAVPASVIGEQFSTYEDAFQWFESEHAVLVALIGEAAGKGLAAYAWRLAWALTDFLDRQGHWSHQVRVQEMALTMAEGSSDHEGVAHTHRNLGHASARLGLHQRAQEHILRSIELFADLSNGGGEAAARLSGAWVFELQKRCDVSLTHAQRALELYERLNDQPGIGRAANAVGWYLTLLGRHEEAIVYCEHALDVLASHGVRHDEAYTWESLGHAYQHLGRNVEALSSYANALDLLRDLGDRYYEAVVLRRVGSTHLASGDAPMASRTWLRALSILDELGHPDAGELRAELRTQGMRGAEILR